MIPSEFLDAVAAGDLARIEAALAADPSLARARTEGGVSAVLWASYHGRREVLAAVLARAGDLDVHEAAAAGAAERVRALLAADPGLVDAPSPDGFTPLGLAAFFGHPETVGLLLAAGARPDAEPANRMRVRPLHGAVACRDANAARACARLLLDRGASPNVVQHGGWTPLHQAASHGDRDLVRLLLAHGADPSARSEDGRTPRDMAAAGGHVEVAGLLAGN